MQRGQAAPQLLQGSTMSPDQVSPPRADEPLAHATAAGGGSAGVSAQPNLDAQKTVGLVKAVDKPAPLPPPPPQQPAPVVTPPPPPLEASIALPDRNIVWGRWQVVAGLPPDFNLAQTMDQNDVIAQKGDYAVLRSRGTDSFVMPNNGSVGFQLKSGEAFVYTNYTPSFSTAAPASLSNGKLTVDFGSQSFATSINVTSGAESFRLGGSGTVAADGRLRGGEGISQAGVMNLQGLLSKQNGGSAAYIFDSRVDEKRTINGVTYWQQNTH